MGITNQELAALREGIAQLNGTVGSMTREFQTFGQELRSSREKKEKAEEKRSALDGTAAQRYLNARENEGGGGGLGSFAGSVLTKGLGGAFQGLANEALGAELGGPLGAVAGVGFGAFKAASAGYAQGYEGAPLFADKRYAEAAGSRGAEQGLVNFGQGLLDTIGLGFLLSDKKRDLAEEKELAERPVNDTIAELSQFARQLGREGGAIAEDDPFMRELARAELARNRQATANAAAVSKIVTGVAMDPNVTGAIDRR